MNRICLVLVTSSIFGLVNLKFPKIKSSAFKLLTAGQWKGKLISYLLIGGWLSSRVSRRLRPQRPGPHIAGIDGQSEQRANQ